MSILEITIIVIYGLNILFCWRVDKWLDDIKAYPSQAANDVRYYIAAIIPIINIFSFFCCIWELYDKRDKLKFSPIEFLSTEAKEEIKLAKAKRNLAREKADKEFAKELSRIKKADKKNKILNTLDLTDEDIEYLKSRRAKC